MSRWHAWHLHYHDDLTSLLTELVSPMVTSWLASRQIDRFFFVRYQLGGPHVRLRLRLLPGVSKAELDRHLRDRARNFFSRHPSRNSWSEAKIRELNAKLLKDDPGAGRDESIADETVVEATYRPEIERYGGPQLVAPTHDFFALSSAVALAVQIETVTCRRSRPGRVRYLPYLLSQILGSATDLTEAQAVAHYPPPRAFEVFQPIVEKAETLFNHQTDVFEHLCRELLTVLGSEKTTQGTLFQGARCLARLLADTNKRQAILGSQLHMTANRLGLSNVEETYLSHLSTLCLERFGWLSQVSKPTTLRLGKARERLDSLFKSWF